MNLCRLTEAGLSEKTDMPVLRASLCMKTGRPEKKKDSRSCPCGEAELSFFVYQVLSSIICPYRLIF